MLTSRGIEYASALQESQITFTHQCTSSNKCVKREFSDWGTGFQLIHGSAEGYYSTNEYDGVGTELLNLADQVKRKNIEQRMLVKNQITSINRSEIDLSASGYWTSNYFEETEELMSDIRDHLANIRNIANYTLHIEGQFISKNFQSSDLLDISQSHRTALLTIELTLKDQFLRRKLVEVVGGISKKNFNWNFIEKKLDDIQKSIKDLSKATYPKAARYPVILSPDTAFSLVHETIGHGCEADQIVSKNSFLASKIGHKVASSELTIVDDSHIRATGWAEFDDEGTKSQGTILVDEGFLVNFLHSKKTAKVLGAMSTGNARATSYLSPPEPRQSNIYLEPKDYQLEELFEEINYGLYIGPTLTASTSIFSGEYSIDCQFAYQIENGQISDMYGPLRLSGHSLDSLSKISAIGKEVETISSFCLKDDSRLPIGAITPPLLISQINVGLG
ncbi:MAG: TldD/PmbA family protein [Candidatus Kariarchaeaceae archaeon]|jgi:predicted Zn-dependent protease